MTKIFNSRLVEWVNDLGQGLLKEMKALEKRNFKDLDALLDALSYVHLQNDFDQSGYKSAKQKFDQVINELQKLPTKNVHFVVEKWLITVKAIILKPYIKKLGFQHFLVLC